MTGRLSGGIERASKASALMVRRRECAVSNHEARISASSFETRVNALLRMRR
jgi:hypothetical protein